MTQLPQEPNHPGAPKRTLARAVGSGLRRMSATQRAAAGVVLIAALTVALWLSDEIASATHADSLCHDGSRGTAP